MRWYLEGRTWRVAAAVNTLARQLDALWPERHGADGTVGDLSHQARASDHNPNGYGVVTAIDVGIVGDQGRQLTTALVAARDPRVKYIIHDRTIWRSYPKPGIQPWTPSPYTGSNPHATHVHVSVSSDPTLYDQPDAWLLPGIDIPEVLPPTVPEPEENIVTQLPTLKLRDGFKDGRPQHRQHVRMGQALLAIAGVIPANTFDAQHRPDGLFGSGTEAAVKQFQTSEGLKADGIIGQNTWAALLEVD